MVTHGSARNKLNAWHFILFGQFRQPFICYENSMKYQVMGSLVRQFADYSKPTETQRPRQRHHAFEHFNEHA